MVGRVEGDQGGAARTAHDRRGAGVDRHRVEPEPQVGAGTSVSASTDAAAQATGPPLVSTTAVPLRRQRVREPRERGRRRASVKAAKDSSYVCVVLARRPALRRLLEPPLEGGLLRLALRASWAGRGRRAPAGGRTRSSRRRPSTSAVQPAAVEDPGRGLAVPSHLAGDQRGRARPRGQRARRRAPRDCSWPVRGEVVVVGGAERGLSVPHQEDPAHGAARTFDEPVEPAADDLHGRRRRGRTSRWSSARGSTGSRSAGRSRPSGTARRPRRTATARGVTDRAACARQYARHELVAGQHAGQVRRHPPHHLELLGRRRPAPSRPSSRRGPSAGRRGWPSPSRARPTTRVTSSSARTRLSSLKSLWITQVATSSGWCASSHAITVLEVGHVVGAGVAVADRPALDLAPDVAVPLAEVGEPGGRRVDAVQLGEHVDRVQAQLARLLGRQRHVGGPLAAGDHAVDALHGVEVAADDRRRRRRRRPSTRRSRRPARAPTG